MVDTGAEVTVVPHTIVPEAQLLPETLEVVGAMGIPVETRLAEVELGVMRKRFKKKVAVASADMLCKEVLYSVTMGILRAEQMLAIACAAETTCSPIPPVAKPDNKSSY